MYEGVAFCILKKLKENKTNIRLHFYCNCNDFAILKIV